MRQYKQKTPPPSDLQPPPSFSQHPRSIPKPPPPTTNANKGTEFVLPQNDSSFVANLFKKLKVATEVHLDPDNIKEQVKLNDKYKIDKYDRWYTRLHNTPDPIRLPNQPPATTLKPAKQLKIGKSIFRPRKAPVEVPENYDLRYSELLKVFPKLESYLAVHHPMLSAVKVLQTTQETCDPFITIRLCRLALLRMQYPTINWLELFRYINVAGYRDALISQMEKYSEAREWYGGSTCSIVRRANEHRRQKAITLEDVTTVATLNNFYDSSLVELCIIIDLKDLSLLKI
jgi:hypothetical protein